MNISVVRAVWCSVVVMVEETQEHKCQWGISRRRRSVSVAALVDRRATVEYSNNYYYFFDTLFLCVFFLLVFPQSKYSFQFLNEENI